jgi:hypothetical protein
MQVSYGSQFTAMTWRFEVGLMQVHDAVSAMTEAICETFGLTEPDRTRVNTTCAAAKRWVTARELRAATAASVPGSDWQLDGKRC